jgi:hypothetical protein
MVINDEWYNDLVKRYGEKFIIKAGYFEEDYPYNQNYKEYAVKNEPVIYYPGAFYPFHEGHLTNIINAIDSKFNNVSSGTVIVHFDHSSYFTSKFRFSSEMKLLYEEGINYLKRSFPYKNWKLSIIFEDSFKNGCSRNFTRAYADLYAENKDIYFLCGGDRAAFSLTFIDKGNCIVVGRSNHPDYIFFKQFYLVNDRITFIYRNDDFSSTFIRNSELQ